MGVADLFGGIKIYFLKMSENKNNLYFVAVVLVGGTRIRIFFLF